MYIYRTLYSLEYFNQNNFLITWFATHDIFLRLLRPKFPFVFDDHGFPYVNNFVSKAVTKALIGGGGWIFIYSRSARRISFEINCNES